jgi:hypothetical protein
MNRSNSVWTSLKSLAVCVPKESNVVTESGK